MTTTITGTGGTHTPDAWLSYDIRQDGRNHIAVLLSGDLEVQLNDAGPRKGTGEALFRCASPAALATTHAAADDLRADIATGQVLALADTNRPLNDMSFVLDGQLELLLEPNRKDWRVRFEFLEVPA